MSDEQDGHSEELVEISVAVSAQEKRALADGRQPPPASVRLPRIGSDGVVVPDAVTYPLIDFPWEPWTLTLGRDLTQAQASAYTDWLGDSEAERLAMITAVLRAAGGPLGGLPGRPEDLAGLGGWILDWFRLIGAPLMDGFFHDDVDDRLGMAYAAWGRSQHRLVLPFPGEYLSPTLITGINGLLPADRQRLWFFDHGPPMGIVTRATAEERDAHWWTVDAGRPIEPVADEVLAAFHGYGWPAILAALESPGFPPDPAVRWARTFPPVPSAAVRQSGQPELVPLARLLRTAGHRGQVDLFAELADDDPVARFVHCGVIMSARAQAGTVVLVPVSS